MASEEYVLNQAENVAAQAEETSGTRLRKPGIQSINYFMGGANAGEVLARKSNVLSNSENNLSEISFEYFADLDDPGDVGFLKNVIVEYGFTLIPNQSQKGLGNMPHWISFVLAESGLYAHEKMGALTGLPTKLLDIKATKITSDAKLAHEFFDAITVMPVSSKGRDLYALFMNFYQRDPYKFSYALMNQNYGQLDFDDEELIAEAKKNITEGANLEEIKYELAWNYHYKGKIPASWRNWHGITEDLKKAEKSKTQLTPELLDAAVTHPHNLVVSATYERQLLNTNQLAIIFARQGGAPWKEKEISKEQLEKGVTQEQINEAKELAKEKGKQLFDFITKEKVPSLG